MNKYIYHLLLIITTLILTSCGGGSSVAVSVPNVQTQIEGKLKRSTESSLTDYFRQASEQQQAAITPVNSGVIFAQASATVTTSSNAASNTSVSTTNIQENGVDEADLIKTSADGRYIYSVDKNESAISLPPILNSTSNKVSNSDSIRIMGAENTQLTEVKKLLSNDKQWHITGLYLDESKDNLVALSSNNTNYWGNWFRSGYFSQQTTDLFFFDINDPSIAALSHTLSFDGTVVDSRRNGDVLYMVLRHFPDYVYNKEDTQNSTTARDLLPHYRLNNATKQPVVLAENCYQEDNGGKTKPSDIITLVAVNLASDTPEIASQCYVGAAEAIYASQEALYLATTRSQYQTNNDIASYTNTVTTDIHKFAYNAMTFDYRGSAEVRGHLGHQQDRKSFRFSEHNGLLRVVTFSPEQWNTMVVAPSSEPASKSPVSLTILEEDTSQKALRTVAQLPNQARPEPIGLPGERLYASRFIGDKAYFVTFRVTDPLYLLDLSNPADPFIAGELKIDGYSDYLQPISENLLLGIGKDAIASTNGDDGRGAWYQGVKLSLIDVSDPTNPREADKWIIGKRGTESSALYNHHALTSLKVGDIQRIALPIRLHEQLPMGNFTVSASSYYGYTSTGLHRFEIDINNQTITEKPAMIVSDNQTTSYGGAIDNHRSVMIKEDVHYLHNGEFRSQKWNADIKFLSK